MTNQTPTLPATVFTPALAAKILKVQKAVGGMEKTANNAYAKFKYVPIDDYYKAMKPLLDDAGLFVAISELETDILEVAGVATYKALYEISLIDDEGNCLTVRRAIYTKYVGAQSSGTCLSYVQKFFYRTTFNIATGEGGEFEATENMETDADAFPHAPNKTAVRTHPKYLDDDYSYDGAPYRLYQSGLVIGSYDTVKEWGLKLKSHALKKPEGTNYRDNDQEVARITRSIENDKTLTSEQVSALMRAMEPFRPPPEQPVQDAQTTEKKGT